MRTYLAFSMVFISSLAHAGGTIGGSTGGKAMMIETLMSEQLPKVMINADQYRRINARLSMSQQAEIDFDGSRIEFQKIHDRIVDTEVTKEFIPVAE